MKLRNKKTGEICELKVTVNGEFAITKDDEIIGIYSSLAELNEKLEDYKEEPKKYWYISDNGEVYGFSDYFVGSEIEEAHRKIGNLFETKEEAEKAVEKLKAWKRLKDYNVKFNLDFVRNRINFTYSVNNPLLDVLDGEEQIFNNMKIIFGGEE